MIDLLNQDLALISLDRAVVFFYIKKKGKNDFSVSLLTGGGVK